MMEYQIEDIEQIFIRLIGKSWDHAMVLIKCIEIWLFLFTEVKVDQELTTKVFNQGSF